MRILSIEKTGRGGMFRLAFDDGSALVIRKEVLVDFGLRRNDVLTSDRLDEIRRAEAFQEAYVAAMRLLNYRMRTGREMGDRLRRKGFDQSVVDAVVGKLLRLGMIDDRKFAEAFVAGAVGAKPLGKRELRRRLREKGVSKEVALEATASVDDEQKQTELAFVAAEKRAKLLRGLDPQKARARLISFLARRGFEWGVIAKVVRKLLDGDYDENDL